MPADRLEVDQQVSIRARPIGRAMPYVRILRCSQDRFNPRPANWPGDADSLQRMQPAARVSIRARPIGRAMLRAANALFWRWSKGSLREPPLPGKLRR